MTEANEVIGRIQLCVIHDSRKIKKLFNNNNIFVLYDI
jgi:hypothetical protein